MKFLLSLLLFSFAITAWGQPSDLFANDSNKINVGKYYILGDVQLGYPFVTLTNPDGTEAYFNGLAARLGADIPIYDGESLDVFFEPGIKYLDLKNSATTASQTEVANLLGPGVGLAIRYSKVRFGARYYHLWGRHYATGVFSGRSTYDFSNLEYFGGIYFEFDRLGLGLTYSVSQGEIKSSQSQLSVNTPYKDIIISIQGTFNVGSSFWNIIESLF